MYTAIFSLNESGEVNIANTRWRFFKTALQNRVKQMLARPKIIVNQRPVHTRLVRNLLRRRIQKALLEEQELRFLLDQASVAWSFTIVRNV